MFLVDGAAGFFSSCSPAMRVAIVDTAVNAATVAKQDKASGESGLR